MDTLSASLNFLLFEGHILLEITLYRWSFGCVLWQLFHNLQLPLAGISNNQIVDQLQQVPQFKIKAGAPVYGSGATSTHVISEPYMIDRKG